MLMAILAIETLLQFLEHFFIFWYQLFLGCKEEAQLNRRRCVGRFGLERAMLALLTLAHHWMDVQLCTFSPLTQNSLFWFLALLQHMQRARRDDLINNNSQKSELYAFHLKFMLIAALAQSVFFSLTASAFSSFLAIRKWK